MVLSNSLFSKNNVWVSWIVSYKDLSGRIILSSPLVWYCLGSERYYYQIMMKGITTLCGLPAVGQMRCSPVTMGKAILLKYL